MKLVDGPLFPGFQVVHEAPSHGKVHPGFYEKPDVKHHAWGLHPFKSGRTGFPRFVHGRSVLQFHTKPVGKGWKTRTPYAEVLINRVVTS